MWYLAYSYIFLTSLLLSFLLTRWMRSLAPRLGFIDQPSSRKFHTRPVPLMGGVAVFLSFFITILLNLALMNIWPSLVPEPIRVFLPGVKLRLPWLLAVLAGSFVVAGVGLADDKWGLQPKWKLLVQFIVAVFIASVGIRIKLFIPSEILSFLITVIWIIVITNAFNLLDNMDGVSAGVAFMSSFILLIVAVILNEYFIAALLAVFMGSVLGFLYFNFPPATVFMGDCGSMFIGFMISVITILGTYYKANTPTLFPVVIPILVLAVPIFDTLSVIYIRLRKGLSMFQPDKNHFSHRLVNRGMNVPAAVRFVYLVTLCVGLPSVLLPILPLMGVLIVFFQAVGIISIIAILEFYSVSKGGAG